MARQNAFLRFWKTLRARRAELIARLADESTNLQDFEATDVTGDIAHAAFERESAEMSAHLKDLETREFDWIERALVRLQQGAYGICENCRKQIPLARLNALPYTTLCIQCERDRETHTRGPHLMDADNWTRLADSEARTGDQPINLTEMERRVSASRRS